MHQALYFEFWECTLKVQHKIGFIGLGNLAQAIIKGLVEKKVVESKFIFGSNRSEGKLQKAAETFGIQTCSTNEEVIEKSSVVILAMKPQDLIAAIEPISSIFNEKQIVISLAAGITLRQLAKKLPQCRIVRLMANTPALISRGVIGFVMSGEDKGLQTMVEDLFEPLGYVIKVEDEDKIETITVSSSAGTGFVFELMMYWQEWIEEHGFESEVARKMTVETFLGTSLLASQQSGVPLEDLLYKVTSKKGVTMAGLQSMRELEIERALRYSFEKAALRNQELAKET